MQMGVSLHRFLEFVMYGERDKVIEALGEIRNRAHPNVDSVIGKLLRMMYVHDFFLLLTLTSMWICEGLPIEACCDLVLLDMYL
jgi:hypothetical protein